MKRLIIAVILGMALPALAMEDETVTLITIDNQEFRLPIRLASRSETIKNLNEDVSGHPINLPSISGHPIHLPHIDGRTFAKIVELLQKLDRLLAANEELPQSEQRYIPRIFQPIVNQILKNSTNQEVGQILDAANYLAVPFILNAVGAVIADRMCEGLISGINLNQPILKTDLSQPKGLRESRTFWNYFKDRLSHHFASQGNLEEDMQYRYRYYGFGVPHKDARNYILKHLVLRRCGQKEEFSIADYIDAYGQPRDVLISTDVLYSIASNRPHTPFAGITFTNERGNKITSLFGIDRILNRDEIGAIDFDNQCLFDPVLDPQAQDVTFESFPNLEYIKLNNTPIRNEAATGKFLRGLGSVDFYD